MIMVAGVAAILVQGYRLFGGNNHRVFRYFPEIGFRVGAYFVDKIRRLLLESARDIVSGTSANGHIAQVGNDVATGAGLVDALSAIIAGWVAITEDEF